VVDLDMLEISVKIIEAIKL